MKLEHGSVIHLVDVIASQDHNILGLLTFNCINVLINGIGGALVPAVGEPLLGRDEIDEFAEFTAKVVAPCEVDMPVKRLGFVLCQQQQATHAAVQAVAEYKIDDPVEPAEWDRGLGTIPCERFKT